VIADHQTLPNAMVEDFNSVIQLIKAIARGFRNFESYRAQILFHFKK
jgi:transposase